MYKKAARIYQRLKARKIVGSKAKPPKARRVASLPCVSLDSSPPKVPQKNASGSLGKEQPILTLAEQHVVSGLLFASEHYNSFSLSELMRRMPLNRPSDSVLMPILQKFARRGWLDLTRDGRVACVRSRKLRRLIETMKVNPAHAVAASSSPN